MNPVPVAWAVTAPHPDDLQTGDLLFPRRGALAVPPAATGQAARASPAADERVETVLGARTARLAGREPQPVGAAPVAPGGPSPFTAPAGATAGPAGRDAIDLADPDQLYLMLRILNASFADLTREWLQMSVERFVRHPLFRLLLGAMQHDLGGGFFVGHSAMVLRETAGRHADDGRLFVIEANTTDFARYRVSVHPYHAPQDPSPCSTADAELMSGWVNYRAAQGQKVWAARPRALDAGADPAAVHNTRQRILECAKELLGRPYGFFDSPTLGDTDRLYCSEFVHAVFGKAGGDGVPLGVDDCRSWSWLLDNIEPASLRAQLREDLQQDGLLDRVRDKPFFLLTVQMLWRSAGLRHFPYPWGEGPYG